MFPSFRELALALRLCLESSSRRHHPKKFIGLVQAIKQNFTTTFKPAMLTADG